MSVTNDAVAVLKNRFLSVIQKSDVKNVKAEHAPLIDEQSPPTAPNLLDESLLAVARDSADIRRNHDAILNKAATLSTLQGDLLAAFDRAYQALEQLAESRSQLAKAEAVARFEHEARETAARRLANMTATYHQTVSELERLRPEAKQLEETLRQANDRLANHEIESSSLSDQLKEARSEIERRRADEINARRDHEALSTELAAANAYVSQKVGEIATLHERCEIAEQSSRASARALDEARGNAAGAMLRLDEERVHLASAESRIAALETQLRDLGDKFSSARATWSQDAERFNDTIARLKDDLSQALGRDEAHQRLLSAAQSEMAALRRANVDLEAVLAESRLATNQTNARALAAEGLRDEHALDLATSKRLHQSLLRRVKPMIAALREKSGETIKLNATLGDFERRFQAYQGETADAIRVLQEKEMQLVASLETERARRVVAEGALAIDRSFRPGDQQRREESERRTALL